MPAIVPQSTHYFERTRIHEDPTFDFELLRCIAHARYGGSDVTEILTAAHEITAGDFESWYEAFFALAQRVEEQVNRLAAKTPSRSARVSMRDRLFAAAGYYRAADFFLHGRPDDVRIGELWARQTAAFDRALALLDYTATRHLLPAARGDFDVEAVFYRAPGAGPKPTLIMCNGFDGAQEEMLHIHGFAALERGFNVITYEGPGQPTVRRRSGAGRTAGFIADWERAASPVVDFALTQADLVDPARLVSVGYSLGGLLAVRAAAFNKRFAAAVAVDAASSLEDALQHMVGPERFRMFAEGRHAEFDASVTTMLTDKGKLAPTGARWGLEHGMWSFDATSPAELLARAADLDLNSRVYAAVRCPVFIGKAEHDEFFGGQPEAVKKGLGPLGTLVTFLGQDGAGAHCQVGAASLLNAEVFAWLDEKLA